MSETDAANALSDENTQDEKTPKTRKSKARSIDRAREESEAITKDLGPEIEGRRRTRSAAKGIPATLPPPAKKEKKTPVVKSDIKPKGRGRPKKNASVSEEEAANDEPSGKGEIADKIDTDDNDEHEAEKEVKKDEKAAASSENNASHEDTKEEASNNNGDRDAVKDDKQKVVSENGEKETAKEKPEDKKASESKAGEVPATAAE